MPVAGRVWVLEEFYRGSGRYRGNHGLLGLSDDGARSLLGLSDLGDGDVFDLLDASLSKISLRFGLEVSPKDFEYLLGREAPRSS